MCIGISEVFNNYRTTFLYIYTVTGFYLTTHKLQSPQAEMIPLYLPSETPEKYRVEA
jgi:hypothetical protein